MRLDHVPDRGGLELFDGGDGGAGEAGGDGGEKVEVGLRGGEVRLEVGVFGGVL